MIFWDSKSIESGPWQLAFMLFYGTWNAHVHASHIKARLESVGEAGATDAIKIPDSKDETNFTGAIKLLQPVKRRPKSNMSDAVNLL